MWRRMLIWKMLKIKGQGKLRIQSDRMFPMSNVEVLPLIRRKSVSQRIRKWRIRKQSLGVDRMPLVKKQGLYFFAGMLQSSKWEKEEINTDVDLIPDIDVGLEQVVDETGRAPLVRAHRVQALQELDQDVQVLPNSAVCTLVLI